MERDLWVKLLSILYDICSSPMVGESTRQELDQLMLMLSRNKDIKHKLEE